MMATMLCEHSDCAPGFADNVKRPLELHDRAVHEFKSKLTVRITEPWPNLVEQIFYRSSEARRKIRCPLRLKLPGQRRYWIHMAHSSNLANQW